MAIIGYYNKMQYYEEESFGPYIPEPEFISISPKEPLYMKKCKKIKKVLKR